MRLVQLFHPQEGRRVAQVDGDSLWLLKQSRSVYECAQHAIRNSVTLPDRVRAETGERSLDYKNIYRGLEDWKLLPPFDHPEEKTRCLVSGTGLTHRKGAANRNAMHQKEAGQATQEHVTDSMRIYQWGVEEGKPEEGGIGVQPEWFYKGNGTILRAHGQPLEVPCFAEDGGEEPEVAGVYLIDEAGTPRRLGFVIGNEFSDHRMERRNYLYLAPSKLRTCAIGPELCIDADFTSLEGTVSIERDGETFWSASIVTGEAHMVHSLVNLEHHHFKYPAHRHPGDAHIHFFGTGAFSFGAGITLEEDDLMIVDIPTLGRSLKNPVSMDHTTDTLVTVSPL